MNPNYLKGRRLEYEIQHKLQNAGWLAVFQKKWNKWYHNNGKKNCSIQYPQVQINDLILTPIAEPKERLPGPS